jgi:hypothetical protein
MLEPKLLMQEPDNYYGSLFQRAEQQYKRFPINQMILDDIGNDKKICIYIDVTFYGVTARNMVKDNANSLFIESKDNNRMKGRRVIANGDMKYVYHDYGLKKPKNMIFFDLHFENSMQLKDVVYGMTTEENKTEDIKGRKRMLLSKSKYAIPEFLFNDILPEIKHEFLEKEVERADDARLFFKIKLPSEADMEKIIIRGIKRWEWKTEYNRIPNIQSIAYGPINIQKFDLKQWMGVIKQLGGPEKFRESMDFQSQVGFINLFELIGAQESLKALNDFGAEIWHQVDLANSLKKIKTGAIDRDLVIKFFNKLFKAFKETKSKKDTCFRCLNAWDMIFEAEQKKGGEGYTYSELIKLSLSLQYKDIGVNAKNAEESSECLKVANASALASVGQSNFLINQEIWLETLKERKNSSRGIPTLIGHLPQKEKMAFQMTDPTDARNLVVGNETHCCQHVGSIGGACVRWMVKNPKISTIFRITRKGITNGELQGETIAQSFVWRDGDKLVFDNIESLGSDVREEIIDCYLEYIKMATPAFKSLGIKYCVVGTGYGSNVRSLLNKYPTVSNESKPNIPDNLGYTDADGVVKVLKEIK